MIVEYVLVWALSNVPVAPQKFQTESKCLQLKQQLEKNVHFIGMSSCIPNETNKLEGVTFI